jgi:hypothetical protein
MLSDLALVCNFKATSDLPQWLNTDEREALRTFLEAEPHIEQVSRYIFHLDGREVDFSPAIPLPTPPRGLNSLGSALMGWLGNQRWVLTLMNRLNDIALKKMQAR